MTFFYDLNKRLAGLASKQELTESKQAKPDFLDVDKDGNKKESFKQAVKDAEAKGSKKEEELDEGSTGDYSAKKARAGKDIGKPGKAFSKIAKSAGERYGSKERGEKVAGAVLAKLRSKANEGEMEEGNEFSGELAKAKASGAKSFEVDGKEYPVKEDKKKKSVFDPEVARSMFAHKDDGKFDVHDTGYSKRYTRKHEEEPEDSEDDAPKAKGRKTVGAGKGKKIGAKVKGTSKIHSKGAIAEDGAEDCCPHCGHSLVDEVAPPGAKAERMVKHIKKAYSKDGKLTPKEKAIAYATTWAAHNKGKVEEESTAERDDKAEEVGKKVTKAVEKAEDAPKKSKGGMQFGKGVYESMNSAVEKMIVEGMNISVNMTTDESGEPKKSITVSAEGAEAEALAQLLNLAGLHGQEAEAGCGCGTTPCSCEQMDEAYGDTKSTKNNPDWPTDEETTGEDDELLRRWAGGLNKPKSTGQTTAPVVNRDPARGSIGTKEMAESTEKLGMNLYKELKQFKG